MILFVDNYDSFSYNLVRYFNILSQSLKVIKNDELSLNDIKKLQFKAIIISPGFSCPKNAGICLELIKYYHDKIPILGICLGLQVIAESFGGHITKALQPIHGKVSTVVHNKENIFNNIPSPLKVVRYHSLVVDKNTYPSCLEISAWDEQKQIMALNHKTLPIFATQFHPESHLSEYGLQIIENFLTYVN